MHLVQTIDRKGARAVDSIQLMRWWMMQELIANATVEQSLLRWRRLMEGRSQSVPSKSRRQSRAGCCVRAVVVHVMVDDVSSVVVAFFVGLAGEARVKRGRSWTWGGWSAEKTVTESSVIFYGRSRKIKDSWLRAEHLWTRQEDPLLQKNWFKKST